MQKHKLYLGILELLKTKLLKAIKLLLLKKSVLGVEKK